MNPTITEPIQPICPQASLILPRESQPPPRTGLRRWVRSSLQLGAIAIACATAVGAAPAEEIDDYIAGQMSRQRIAGLSLAVLKDGQPVKVKGYGLADLELGRAATPETIYEIGSVSKQFIAGGIVLLSREGKVGLDDSIRKYLEEAPEAWQGITIRHLLTHTSGLIRETTGLQLTAQTDIEAIRSAFTTPLTFQPGEKWQYSNLGYFALAEVISRAAQKPWPEYLQEKIFGPLGMTSTHTTAFDAPVPERATGYHWMDSNTFQKAPRFPGVRPSGAFISTVLDLAKWDAALDTGTLFSADERALMWTPVKLADGSERPYGFGWEVSKAGGHRQVKHAGTMFGFRSQLLRFPDDRLTIIVLTNATQSTPEKIASGLAAFYLPDLKPKPVQRTALTLPADVLEKYVGPYQIPGNRVLTVARHENQIAVTMPLQGLGKDIDPLLQGVSLQIALLTPESESRFFDQDDPSSTYVFAPDAEGKLQLQVENAAGRVMQKASKIAR